MLNTRPLSPHLSVYRWRVNMLQSTLHRITGMFLCLGAILVTWGLVSAATGEAAWYVFTQFCGSLYGVTLLILWTWSLLFHLCNGIQHLVRDMGKNFGPPTRNRTRNPVYWFTGWVVIGISVALTVLVFIFLALHTRGLV